ncbi:hypothetical protein Q4574_01190 [Aliiglaciecola sp. 3_MG-2023]|uniref:hypothetical protein n=1 Tax=Aliiglaciecola sp. 3_MG-2023 TaxID=3062644 RepID=UPI0026E17F47|nr:hypothetical protein [Aliiglaciecola sp. 3_MG-2023]MDO6691872.1 hypothetical protein [Aliiglaciecola sp. 3_MG-2023]
MSKKLMLSGGCLRPNGFELGEGKYYGKASLVLLDLESGEFSQLLTKTEGGENYPKEHPNLQFTAGCVDGDKLWLPTDTEVHCYSLPGLKPLSIFSHPCFHNIHSVHVLNGDLVVTSTGLDNVVVMDIENGEIKSILNTEGKDPWHRFDKHVDYRLVHSTRPHDSHPNFVFKIDEDLWATRCTQEDAVNLSKPTEIIDISLGGEVSVHDGIWWENKLVFTRVDGYLVFSDPKSKKTLDTFDPFSGALNRPMGWCRGLHIDGDIFYIGYSKLRKTNLKSKIKFLTKGNFKYSSGNNSLIVALNIRTKKVERIYTTPEGLIDAIYGILPFNYE